MSAYRIGHVERGNILRRKRGPVELWETLSENNIIYLRVTAEDVLWAVRRYRKDADKLFESVCSMFPNLEPEKGQRKGYSNLFPTPLD